MASRIKGITIEIGGDTKPLERALSDVNKASRTLQTELKDVDRLLKLDPGNTELIAQKMKLLQAQTANTTEKLKRLENAQEQVNRQFREGKINDQQYRTFNRQLEQTRIQLRTLEEASQSASNEMNDLGESGDRASSKLSKLGKSAGETAKSVGSIAVKGTATAVAAIGTAAVGMGVAAVKSADDAKRALNSLQVQTGATDQEMAVLEESMMTIYRNNFGENFEDVAQTMAQIEQQTHLTGQSLEQATTHALMLRDSFNFDTSESTRSVNQMMKTFGVTAYEAYTLIAQGAQQGLNANEDLLDTINEYSMHFDSLGLDAETMFNMLENGSQTGAFSIDKLGDAVKEFGIRVKDGSTSTKGAFTTLALDATTLTTQFAQGGAGAEQAFQEVTQALSQCEDKVQQNAVGVALFGTMWEDLGSDAVLALTQMNGSFDGTASTLAQINQIKYDDFQSAISGIGRIIETDFLIPMGKEVLPLLSTFATAIANGFQTEHLTAFTSVLETLMAKAIEAIGTAVPQLAASLMGFLEGLLETLSTILPELTDATLQLVGTMLETLASALPTLIPVMIEGLIGVVQSILDNLPLFVTAAIELVLGLVQGLLEGLPLLLEQGPIVVGKLVEAIVQAIPQLIDAAISLITSLVTFILENLPQIIQSGIEIMYALTAGLIQAIPHLLEATPKLVEAIVSILLETNWIEIGLNLVRGIAQGIMNGVGSVVEAAKDMASSVWNSITCVFDMHSPSRLAIKVFQKDFVENGIGQGILKGIPQVIDDTKRMSTSIVDAMQTAPQLTSNMGQMSLPVVSQSSMMTSAQYTDGDIIIQNMSIHSKENAQYFAEYLYSLKKTRNRMQGVRM